jgi:protein-tyrosine phosphatase
MRVIETYTLSGAHVLVHCRGGVGRAGVIACCWLIRLGLCGWLICRENETENLVDHDRSDVPPFHRDSHNESTKRETIDFVERVISVVRRQRSMKAIETYEQVKFLVEFVEYISSKNLTVD